MAREEQDREDLLAEAVALVERIEIELPDGGGRVVAGFRRDGCGSLYFDADPAYHFNTRHELRRAFSQGRLLKAERGRLVTLRAGSHARRSAARAARAERRRNGRNLRRTHAAIAHAGSEAARRDYRLVGQVPAAADVIGRLLRWLPQIGATARIAVSAHVV